MDKAFQIVEDANAPLDETDKLKEQWYASKDAIESTKRMRITAQGYIGSMKAT
jgi:hypothetical protein